MGRLNIKTFVVIVLATSIGAGLLVGCGGSGEERQLIRSFFLASRVDDRATLGNLAMVAFDPDTDGTVPTFSIENVTEEQRRTLRLGELGEELARIQAEEQEFRERKKVYQDEHMEAIGRVIEAERADENAGRRDQEVQEAWTTWREEERMFAKQVSGALSAVNEESLVAQVSVFDPSNPIDVRSLGGELISKEVTINATVEKDGASEERTMVITLQKVELQGSDGALIDGRWVITIIA